MRALIGKPWAVPCDPPNSFDCWELCRHVRKTAFGKDTPSVVDAAMRRPVDRRHIKTPPRGWLRLSGPENGCVARIGVAHVGVYIGGGKVIHARHGAGVVVDGVADMLGEDVTYWELADA